jgi:bifunctional non-homologous end joining protein LigD
LTQKDKKVQVEIEGHPLEISHLDKVLYPASGFTKAQVIDYYTRIAPVMLPHLRGKPVTLKRYPDGVDGEFFFEKECPAYHPDWVSTSTQPSKNVRQEVNYCVVDNLATLVWLANLAALELHTLLAPGAEADRPTCVAFDLDPGSPADVLDSAWAAVRLREILDQEGLRCIPKTSGGKGIHVFVPLNEPIDFTTTKRFAHSVAQLLEKTYPERVTSMMKKDLRAGKVFVDWSQNDPHKTTVCAYSLRARERPIVSTPLTWDELEEALNRGDPGMLSFEAGEVLSRAEERGDLFARVLELKQDLSGVSGIS